MKTIIKQKKCIENGRKPQFGFKIWEQYKYNFLEQKQKIVTKHTLVFPFHRVNSPQSASLLFLN